MIKSTRLLLPLCMGAMMSLAACTTTSNSSEKMSQAESSKSQAETAKAVSEELSQTKQTASSEDGKMVCKRTAVVGSNFKKKVCATAEEWTARSEADRRTTEGIQRSAGPGVSN